MIRPMGSAVSARVLGSSGIGDIVASLICRLGDLLICRFEQRIPH
jgi:hypothetical protein